MFWLCSILLIYLGVCWIGCAVVVKVFGAGDRHLWSEISSACGHNRAWFYLVLALTTLVYGPLLPFVALRCFWNCWQELRAEERKWRKFQRTHRPANCEPIHPANLPRAAQDHIEWHSSILQRLGFVAAFLCQLKPEPLAIYSLCLLSRDGETVADISLIDETPTVSFVSILENGHVLETGCTPAASFDVARINRSGRFTAQLFEPTAEADDLQRLYRQHLGLLSELEERHGCGTLQLARDQVADAKRYENVSFGTVRFSLGEIDQCPAMLPCPVAPARRVSVAIWPAADREPALATGN